MKLARSLDIPRAVANLRFFATAILHTGSDLFPTDDRALNYTLRRPRGVAGLISPWNLPLYLFTWKIAPAIATGNTVVAKPSELTPWTAAMLAELSAEVGLPPGVLNVVHGLGASAGSAIVDHPDVPAISFTGGTATGATIARSAAPGLQEAVPGARWQERRRSSSATSTSTRSMPGIVRSAFENQGEICLCGSRLFVEAPLFDRFVAALRGCRRPAADRRPARRRRPTRARSSRRAHREKVESYIALARELGGEIVTGGGRPAGLPARVRDGYFVEPTVVTGLPVDCRVNMEEIFGPVVTVTPVHGRVGRRGLGQRHAATDSRPRSGRTTSGAPIGSRSALDAGTVWINTWLLRDLRVPFGGMKESGVGREGGDEALRFFTEPKTVSLALE